MRKKYEIWILITYIGVVLTCVYLNFFANDGSITIANIIVNAVMLIIAGLILLRAYLGSLRPVMNITSDIKRVIARIEDDAKHTHRFLWEKYNEEKEELFAEDILKERFKDYRYELNRILHMDNPYYKCDIEDYVNYDMIDSVISRNRMNQVAGVMTGLGILGTFIGLSLGLSSFNTGSTAEITNSIDPLMGGIKVAFHTSIYGMILSLVFNWVYRQILDDAQTAVSDFVSTYRKYVMPDATADSINRLMDLMRMQTESLDSLSKSADRLFNGGLQEIVDPHFARLNDTVTGFANMATKNQMDQLTLVVNAFISRMNQSLSGMFTELSETIDKTLVVQTENEKQMEAIFNSNVGIANNMGTMTQKMDEMTGALMAYTDKMENLQTMLNEAVESLKAERQEDADVLRNVDRYIEEIEGYRRSMKDSLEMSEASMKVQSQMLAEIRESTGSVPENVYKTLDMMNANLINTEEHINATMDRMGQMLSQMNDTVDYSYRNVEQGFVRTAKSIDELADFMQRLENYYTGSYSNNQPYSDGRGSGR